MGDDDKPFLCSAMGCGMRFTNEDHLAVHMKKHEMVLALSHGTNTRSPSGLFLDQTPTPTKFLRIGEEIGLFQELNKNPFDEAFKKASDVPEQAATDGNPFPGPHSNDLHTPVPPHLKSVDELQVPEAHMGVLRYVKQEPKSPQRAHVITNHSDFSAITALDLSSPKHPTPPKLMRLQQPSSTTSDDDDFTPVSSTQIELRPMSPVATMEMTPPTHTSTTAVATSTVNEILTATTVTAAQSTTVSPPKMSTVLHQPGAVIPHSQTNSGTQQTQMGVPQTNNVVPQTQYTMQVFLQLPNGQTVPVQVPAAITAPGIQVAVPTAVIQKAATPTSSVETPINVTVTPTSTVQSPIPQSTITKQKLKAALQQQAIPSPTNVKISQLPTTTPVGHISQIPTTAQVTHVTHIARVSPEINNHIISPHTSSPVMMDSASIVSDTASSPDTDPTYSMRHKRFSEDDADERRLKFLERNRAAAARCRQKRKHWITSLEKKAEELQNTNSRLQGEVNSLRNEVAQLKVLLLAHKDCPITLQQQSAVHVPVQTISVVEPTSGVVVNTTTQSNIVGEETAIGIMSKTASNTEDSDSALIVMPTLVNSDSSSSLENRK